jgi:muconate cycloisomerase
MKIVSAQLFLLKIPFKMNFTHSKAERFFSDSIILKLTALDDNGCPVSGWGEAVVRDYVSGSLGEGEKTKLLSSAFLKLMQFRMLELSKDELLHFLAKTEVPETELPILCAIETAVLHLLCKTERTDIYDLLGRKPERTRVFYGGTLPILPPPAAEKLLGGYKKMGINSIRVKLGSDLNYNRTAVSLAKKIIGENSDLKVDANAGWSIQDAAENIPMLKTFGISIIEEPFGREAAGENRIADLASDGLTTGITFMADESALTADDIRLAAKEKTFGMFNIRLAKNGGLLHALEMAETAENLGLRYMAGCHVGETGILSAAGRVAASIMKAPEYSDGSYDSHLLSGNITAEDLSFGPGGAADIIRNKDFGFDIDEEKLKGYTDERIECF